MTYPFRLQKRKKSSAVVRARTRASDPHAQNLQIPDTLAQGEVGTRVDTAICQPAHLLDRGKVCMIYMCSPRLRAEQGEALTGESVAVGRVQVPPQLTLRP